MKMRNEPTCCDWWTVAKALEDLTKKRAWHAQALAKAEAAWIELSEAIEAAS